MVLPQITVTATRATSSIQLRYSYNMIPHSPGHTTHVSLRFILDFRAQIFDCVNGPVDDAHIFKEGKELLMQSNDNFFITNREKLNEMIKRFDCEAIHNGSYVYSSYTIK